MPLTRGQRFVPGSALSPRKMIGAKPCPIVHSTTGFVVFRGHGPVPEWLKAWAYQHPLWEITIIGSVEQPANQVWWL